MSGSDNKALEPPHSLESERMVLGCMLTSRDSLGKALEILQEDDFFYPSHSYIFLVLKQEYKAGRPVDAHLLSMELKRQDMLKEVGGVAYIISLSQCAATSLYIDEYSSLIKNKSYSRQAIILTKEALKELSNDPKDPGLIVHNFNRRLQGLGRKYLSDERVAIGEVLSGRKSAVATTSFLDRLKIRRDYFQKKGTPYLTGLPTGFHDLDQKAIILEETNLIVIAGRPAMGKTAFALNILANICFNQGLPVGFMSLEMGRDQLVERLLSMKTGVSGEKIKRGTSSEKEWGNLTAEITQLSHAQFFILDQGVDNVSQVASKARRLKEEEGIHLLAIDYLQLLGSDTNNDSRQYEVAEISRTLKKLAMELKIPIIVIAQLSRKVEERNDKRPFLSDLRDSGQIEQDSDAVLFVYREEYYKASPNNIGKAEIILAKNRHGPTVSVNLAFKKESGAFLSNVEEMKQSPSLMFLRGCGVSGA
jgi:replicative DNA helicase